MNKIILLILAFGIPAIAMSFYAAATTYQIANIYQTNNDTASLPYKCLAINSTDCHYRPLYVDCTISHYNCAAVVNRDYGKAGEYVFYRNGTEHATIAERFNGTIAIIFRESLPTYPYAEEWSTVNMGEDIHFYKQYFITKDGHFAELQLFNNGTVKAKLGDPVWDNCTTC